MADLLPSSPDPSAGDDGDPRVIGVDSDDADDLLAALQSETAREILDVLYDEPATPSDIAEAVDTSVQNVRYHLDRLGNADVVEVADTVYSEKGREMEVYAPAAKPLVVFAGGGDDTTGIEAALSRLLGGLGALGLSSLIVQRLFGGRSVDAGYTFSGENAAADTTAENATDAGPAGGDAATTVAEEAEEADASTPTPEIDAANDAGAETVTDGVETTAEPTTVEDAAETTRIVAEATETTAEATTTAIEGAATAATGLPPGLVFFAGGAVALLALGIAWHLQRRRA